MKCKKCGEGGLLPARVEETGELVFLDTKRRTLEVLRIGPAGDPSGLNPVIVSEKCPGLKKAGGLHGDGCRAGRMVVHDCLNPWEAS